MLKRLCLLSIVFCFYVNGFSTTWENPYFEEAVQQSALICIGRVEYSSPSKTVISILKTYKGDLLPGAEATIYRTDVIGVGHDADHLETGDSLFFMLKGKGTDYTSHTDSYWYFFANDNMVYLPIRDPSSYIGIKRQYFDVFLRSLIDKQSQKRINTRGFVSEIVKEMVRTAAITKEASAVDLQIFGLEVLYYFGAPIYTQSITKYLSSPYYNVRWSCLRAIQTCGGKGAENEIAALVEKEDNPVIQYLLAKAVFDLNIVKAKSSLIKWIPKTSKEPLYLSGDMMEVSSSSLPSVRYAYGAALMKINEVGGSFEDLMAQAPAYLAAYPGIQYSVLEDKRLYYNPEEALKERDSVFWLSLKGGDKINFELNVNLFPNLKKLSLDNYYPPGVFTHLRAFGLVNLFLEHLQTDQIPPEVFDYDTLEDLSIYLSGIKALPPQISQLKKLKKLDLRINDLKELPEEIAQLDSLEEIALYGNDFTEFPLRLLRCKSLKKIDLQSNRIKKIPDEVGRSKTLKSIDLSYNRLTLDEINRVSKFPANIIINTERSNRRYSLEDALEKEDTEGRELEITDKDYSKSIIDLNALSNYTSINLSNDKLKQFPTGISSLHNITEFILKNNNIRNVPDSISYLKSLKRLILNSNNIDTLPDAMSGLALEYLDISSNPIKDLAALSRLKSLKELSVSNINLKEVPQAIVSLDSIWNLDLSHNALTRLPAEVINMRGLMMIRLNNNQFVDFPEQLINSNVYTVILYNNSIKNIPGEIMKMKNLAFLNLSHNDIDQFPESLSNLKIHTLYLAENNLREIPESIGGMKNLAYLNLDKNGLSKLPAAISRLPLKELSLKENNFSESEKNKIRELLPESCKIIWE